MAQVNNYYVCDCGCDLEFEKFRPGLDIHLGERWLLTAPKMSEHIWENFIWNRNYKNWLELREFIIMRYTNRIHRVGLMEFGPYIHLYNQYVLRENTIPLNAKVMFECAF
jgi:hypothetical protein